MTPLFFLPRIVYRPAPGILLLFMGLMLIQGPKSSQTMIGSHISHHRFLSSNTGNGPQDGQNVVRARQSALASPSGQHANAQYSYGDCYNARLDVGDQHFYYLCYHSSFRSQHGSKGTPLVECGC